MSAQRANQLIEAGLWLQVTGDYDGARRLFEQALKLDPENTRARDLLDKGPDGPHSASGTRPPMVPAAWNPFRHDWSVPGSPPPSGDEVAEPPWAEALRGKEFSPDALSAWDTKSNPGVLIEPGRVEPHDPLALVSATTPVPQGAPFRPRPQVSREDVDKLVGRARDLLELDDHSGAMDLILRALELAPHDPEIKKLREKSEQTLLAMYESKLGGLDQVPHVALKEDEIIWLNLDHRAGFLLAQIDGQVRFEELFAISGMSRLDTARILAQLVEEGVIKA